MSFEENVKKFCEYDDAVKELNKKVKEIKNEQKELCEAIIEHMSSKNLEICNAGTYGILTLRTSEVKSSINKETISDSLQTFLNDTKNSKDSIEKLAESGAEFIMNNRSTEKRTQLKRTMVKK
jgi:hypothetical protein